MTELPLLRGDLQRRPVHAGPGVVHQHVDPAQPLDDLRHRPLHLLRAGDVGGHRRRPARRAPPARRPRRSAAAASRTSSATSLPASASAVASARPIPRLPPVTTETLPASENASRTGTAAPLLRVGCRSLCPAAARLSRPGRSSARDRHEPRVDPRLPATLAIVTAEPPDRRCASWAPRCAGWPVPRSGVGVVRVLERHGFGTVESGQLLAGTATGAVAGELYRGALDAAALPLVAAAADRPADPRRARHRGCGGRRRAGLQRRAPRCSATRCRPRVAEALGAALERGRAGCAGVHRATAPPRSC